jgi:phosphoglycerate dehydrogenase-like enzyme
VTAPGFDVSGAETGVRLQEFGLTVDHAGARGGRLPEEVADLCRDATAAIVSSDPFSAAVFAAAPKLRVIARLGVGTDSIDIDAATEAGVLVTTTPGLNDETCADHSMALLLAAVRRVVEHDASVRRGEWDRGGDLTAWDLHGKRVGVIGYGRIGRAVVRRLDGFATDIRVFDPGVDVPARFDCPDLLDLIGWAEILMLHVPLTDGTAGLIGAAEFALMRPGGILVSTARGGVVDETALAAALASGRLQAAALDVFEREPPSVSGLRDLPNIVLSPHIGGLSKESLGAMAAQCVDQVLEALAGRMPDGVVNPGAVERRAV